MEQRKGKEERRRLGTPARIIVLVAAVALAALYVLPLWSINLDAPQYPEGLGMEIWVNTIRGQGPHDLQKINGLNHYIGMQAIEPDSIRELDVMPWVLAGLIVLGLAAGVTGRRRVLATWVGIFAIGALAGLADFYKWGYDYGHNLDPTAAIKIPGMAYQPPVIGSKKILNFTASSWPASGGLLGFGSLALGVVALGLGRRGRSEPGEPDSSGIRVRRSASSESTPLVARSAVLVGAVAALSCALAGCAPGPRPVVLGEDQCAHCMMGVMDARYAAELVTTTGKIYTFDSAECMASFTLRELGDEAVHSLWFTDFANPGRLLPADNASFVIGSDLGSPMSAGVLAFGDEGVRDQSVRDSGGRSGEWTDVVAAVRSGWPQGSPHRGRHGYSEGGAARTAVSPPPIDTGGGA